MSGKTYRIGIAAALGLAAAAAWGGVQAADLKLVIAGVQHGDGQLMVGLFDQAEGFPRRAPVAGRLLAASQRDAEGRVSLVISGLAAGQYAVSVVHDRDGNGKLNTNLMGLPTEPYGFSGKPASFGPPSFADASLRLGDEGASVSIELTRAD